MRISKTAYKKNDTKTALNALYHNKCAYCEIKIIEFQIEHYRPKGSVREDGTHSGYFWLSYEWSNLLPICGGCNEPPSKGTKFPILGGRVYLPKITKRKYEFSEHVHSSMVLTNEQPLLISPEEAAYDPINYFKFNSVGEIEPMAAVGTTEYLRARQTIDDIRLNRQDLQLIKRQTFIDDLIKELGRIETIYTRNLTAHNAVVAGDNLKWSLEDVLSILRDKRDPTHEMSFFWSFLYDNFARLIISRSILVPNRPIFNLIFNNFKIHNP
ncbi:hypothetical protein WBG78_28790 [Chryseolinea sp. T2]